MKIRILGSAAGGGFPQWNCNCSNCSGARQGLANLRIRTQSSIAVCGSDSSAWTLVNASPDILEQCKANSILHPGSKLGAGANARSSSLAAIVLTDAQIDHVAGLLMLRESTKPWPVWCTDSVLRDLTGALPILTVLEKYCGIVRQPISPGAPFQIPELAPLEIHALPLAGRAPPYSPHREERSSGNVIALRFVDKLNGVSACYCPGLAEIESEIWRAMYASNCVLVDGTFWTDDELTSSGLSQRTARDMGHLPQIGARGMIEWLAKLPSTTRKVLIHINNTNPILDENSKARAQLNERGIEVAYDGMEISL